VLIKRTLAIKDIYVPTKRRLTLNARTVHEIAESILVGVLVQARKH
jgi:hypothetical protein